MRLGFQRSPRKHVEVVGTASFLTHCQQCQSIPHGSAVDSWLLNSPGGSIMHCIAKMDLYDYGDNFTKKITVK